MPVFSNFQSAALSNQVIPGTEQEDMPRQQSGNPAHRLLITLPQGLQKVRFHGLQAVEENGHLLPGKITFLI
jgi:hypothetical protein